MINKYCKIICFAFSFVIVLICIYRVTDAAGIRVHSNSLLIQLTSPDEAERFMALAKGEKQFGNLSIQEIESVLTTLREKNVSALIFILIETGNDAIYNMSFPARLSMERSEGSFPNIAYYYARVRPEKGLTELYRLYGGYREQRTVICKALGETKDLKAVDFLIQEAGKQTHSGSSMYAHLAGLLSSDYVFEGSKILSFLEDKLDREEIIMLSNLKANWNREDLISLYESGNNRKKSYVIQYVFRAPETNFDVFQYIIDNKINQKDYEGVLRLIMSDNIRRNNDRRIRQYCEAVLELVHPPHPTEE